MKKLLCSGALALALALTSAANAQTWTDALPGAWIDTTANPLSLSDDGEVDINHTINNALFGAGVARVGSNGAVRFAGSGTSLGFGNAAIPSTNMFSGDQSLAPFWDDINTASGTNGNIFWEEANDGDTLLVSWVGVDFFGGDLDAVDFQLQVNRTGTGTGLAQFVYGRGIDGVRANGGESATIGYQAGGIQNDAQFSFDTAGSVAPGTVLTLVVAPVLYATLFGVRSPHSGSQT
jgi:hypothetical protein